MKKLLSLFISVIIILSFAGCSFDINGLTAPTDPTSPQEKQYTYTDFTAAEKQQLTRYLGEVIPFVPNNQYTFARLDAEADQESFRFRTSGNTAEEFSAYRNTFIGYTLSGTYTDDTGKTWFEYSKGKLTIKVSYYSQAHANIIDVYVLMNKANTPGTGDTPDNDAGNTPDDSVNDKNGVSRVDFTTATNVKNVTDQGYYLDGCPTMGAPAVLVIPIAFSDGNSLTAGNIDLLELAFGENGDYEHSVAKYYNTSSYGQLNLDVTVLDSWYKPKYASTYYADLTDEEGYANGDQVLMDEILQELSKTMDLSLFDSDGNTVIDAIVMINNLTIQEDDFHWAYRYWNYYADDDGYYYEYDGVSANDYVWASYYFLHEYTDDYGTDYSDTSVMNTYTYIHEFGHILGADDYYDTSDAGNHPMDGCDIMDGMFGDHNAYTKFNLGWITTSRLVVTGSRVTLTLEDFSKNGDTIILANNFDSTLGAYQEYYIVVYYTNNGLNSGDNGYFSRDGIVVYHINATLFSEEYGGEIYYDVYNNNTDPSDEYGTEDNLIEFVKSANDTYTYIVGDTLPVTKDDSGKTLGYTLVVDSLTSDTATITFTKR